MFVFDLSPLYRLIRVRGANRIDFLHRMSTGDLLGLRPGEGRATVFTTPIGRMIDHAAVLAFDDSLLVLSCAGQSRLERWLRKYIFFNDDVQLADESAVLPLWGLYGQGPFSLHDANGLGGQSSTERADELNSPIAGLPCYSHRAVGQGVLVVAPPLAGQGAFFLGTSIVPKEGLTPLSVYEDLRIRAGYPAAPNEVNEDHIPLEAGLKSAISFKKGCYIGQEVIARMESRGQMARRLVKLETEPMPEARMQTGDVLYADGAEAGSVTSVTSDGHTALGYVRSTLAKPGQVFRTAEHPVRLESFAGF